MYCNQVLMVTWNAYLTDSSNLRTLFWWIFTSVCIQSGPTVDNALLIACGLSLHGPMTNCSSNYASSVNDIVNSVSSIALFFGTLLHTTGWHCVNVIDSGKTRFNLHLTGFSFASVMWQILKHISIYVGMWRYIHQDFIPNWFGEPVSGLSLIEANFLVSCAHHWKSDITVPHGCMNGPNPFLGRILHKVYWHRHSLANRHSFLTPAKNEGIDIDNSGPIAGGMINQQMMFVYQ